MCLYFVHVNACSDVWVSVDVRVDVGVLVIVSVCVFVGGYVCVCIHILICVCVRACVYCSLKCPVQRLKFSQRGGCSNILETTGNRQMELGFDIFCVGCGEYSAIFIFLHHTEGFKSQAPFDGFLSFPKLLRN